MDRFDAVLDFLDRRRLAALRLALALLVVSAALWLGMPQQAAQARHRRVIHHTSHHALTYYYGANTTKTAAAITKIWPQMGGAYCGISTAMAMVNYYDETHNLPMRFTSRNDQAAIAMANQTSGASQWGYATSSTLSGGVNPGTNAFGGITNIAPDFGTDPRSIAYVAATYAPSGTPYHDYIYRWQFANQTAPSFSTQVAQATTSLARSLATWHEPISVTINSGKHSVLVTGISTSSDAAKTYPASITSVVFSDPMSAPKVSRFQVPFATWAGGHFATPSGIYGLWSAYYSSSLDPEPTVGPYTPTVDAPEHWYGGFTWIQLDSNTDKDGKAISPDFAYTSTGDLMTAP